MSLSPSRLSWQHYSMKLAEVAALRSEDKHIQVGSVAIGHNNEVLSMGFNGAPPGITINWDDRDERRKRVIHSEVNCLRHCVPGQVAFLAVTMLPCPDCMKQIAAYKIKKVYYKDTYERDSFGEQLAKEFGIELIQLKKKKYVLGIGGVARAGKDTACQILIKKLDSIGVKAKRFALADELKSQIRTSLIESYNIDVLNCSPEDKEKIRPDLVAYGKSKRQITDGKFWTNLLEQKINEDTEDFDVAIVSDIRYYHYPEDEVCWVKSKMNGSILHVSRSEKKDDIISYVWAANKDEEENDGKVKFNADFKLKWETGSPDFLERNYGQYLNAICRFVKSETKRL